MTRYDSRRYIRLFLLVAVFLTDSFSVPALMGGEEPGFTPIRLAPYDGPALHQESPEGIEGRLMCGYQGWFTCDGDGSGRGWFHYGRRGEFRPGACTIDYWPDMREMDEDEKYPTAFKHADGSTAYVFSSMNKKTVMRHFEWMKTHGIDGVFVQRFAVQTFRPEAFNHSTTVLSHCREGANRHGRAYAAMYDLSGLRRGMMDRVKDDWRRLVDEMGLTRDSGDKAYLRFNGKPLVAVWGIGFDDNRDYTLEECRDLIEFLKEDEQYGGNAVMVGVPTFWRTLNRDCMDDPLVHEIARMADIVSPWAVGRFKTPEEYTRYCEDVAAKDLAWCKEAGVTFLPVAYPGFSWHNLKPDAPLDAIPRLKGRFLWAQYVGLKRAGAAGVYQAMFDEMDEGTCIFKCTNDPPVGESPFLTYEGLPTDHYLWLAGMGGRLLRGEIPVSDELPARD